MIRVVLSPRLGVQRQHVTPLICRPEIWERARRPLGFIDTSILRLCEEASAKPVLARCGVRKAAAKRSGTAKAGAKPAAKAGAGKTAARAPES